MLFHLLLLGSGLHVSCRGHLRLDIASAIVVLDACWWCLLDFLTPESVEVILGVYVLLSESFRVALHLNLLVKLLLLLLLELSKLSQCLALL